MPLILWSKPLSHFYRTRNRRSIEGERVWIVPAAAALGLALIGVGTLLRYRRLTVDEVDVATTQASPHVLQARDFEGETPVQKLDTGEGHLYHRQYQVDIAHPTMSKEALMDALKANINDFAPREMATFERTKGSDDDWQLGDEFFIRITGPWNGPVRVIDIQPTSFAFITLQGHLEAGEIEFRIVDHPEKENAIRFEIRSWARSSNRTTDFFYRFLGISKFSQTRMWTHFCSRVLQESGGDMLGDIRVTTHRVKMHPDDNVPAWKQYSSQFEQWAAAELNFDPAKREEFTESSGWHIDQYQIGLPSETPGTPAPGGSWEAAKQVLLNYEFPDPGLVTGVFVPDNPLSERIMIIRARFLIFSFLFGVRVSQVIDEERDGGKRGKAQVWGYSYRTLTGHFEMGEITFEVWKFIESGEVEFRIQSYSKTGAIQNIFYRIGFRLFGRSLQVRFGRTAITRMQQLVIQRLAAPQAAAEQPIKTPDVQPLAEDAAATQKVEQIVTNAADHAAATDRNDSN